jgi:branched-chain amino acid transport system permease protein
MLGANFHVVMPYIVMVAILVVRPHGLFGSPEVRRA